ncbi:hypothetical protein PoB_003956200 [Plakobranchus ocellatus]|uniref:Uncharacterized protein n=1 Tax=Plakobranchus ocellatus TaxID=259542 RepID=A0AAV4B0L9_9GAST|nr:hypothetical protein PoB_003956200 [Plakobranchus ocellatus]
MTTPIHIIENEINNMKIKTTTQQHKNNNNNNNNNRIIERREELCLIKEAQVLTEINGLLMDTKQVVKERSGHIDFNQFRSSAHAHNRASSMPAVKSLGCLGQARPGQGSIGCFGLKY